MHKKTEWCRAIAAVLCVTMLFATIAACGKSSKEPADSLIASESFVPATVQEMEDDELTALIKEIVGDDWDGDFSKLTQAQRAAIQQKLNEKGYHVTVTENGIVYYSYTPTADAEEIADAAKTALGDETWSGSFSDMDDDEKVAVRDELRKRGYDVEIGEEGFKFLGEADRKEQTTHYNYDRLPTQVQIMGAVGDVLGSSAALKWDGDMLSLTAEQRKDVLKKLNDYGFDLALNEQGEFYMIHNPSNKVTYKTAYTPMEVNGTTQEQTTVQTTAPEEPPETGTAADKTIYAPNATRTALSTFGGTGGDTFRKVTASKDGGYIVTAWYKSTDGSYAGTDTTWKEQKSAVVKYDKDGVYQWKATLGGKDLINRNGVFLRETAELTDGSIVAVGDTGAKALGATDVMDGLLVCYDASGSLKWTKLFAGSASETFECVCATPDGGFVAGGRTTSSDGDFAGLTEETHYAILVKFSADGTKEWMQVLNSGSLAAYFNALAVTSEGSIYASCLSPTTLNTKTEGDLLKYAGYGGLDSVIFKFNSDGTLLTHCTIAGSGNDEVRCLSIVDGSGVIVGGRYTKNVRDDSIFAGQPRFGYENGDYDAFLIRLDSSLGVEWVKTYGGAANDEIDGVMQIKGGYAVVGASNSTDGTFSFLGSGDTDAFVMTVSENGTDLQKYAINGTKADHATAVTSRNGKQIAVVGSTGSATNQFSGLVPAAPANAYISFFALYNVK